MVSPNSGPRWLIICLLWDASTSGGSGVGPGMRKFIRTSGGGDKRETIAWRAVLRPTWNGRLYLNPTGSEPSDPDQKLE